MLIFTGDSPDRGSDCEEGPQLSKVSCLKTQFMNFTVVVQLGRAVPFRSLESSEYV